LFGIVHCLSASDTDEDADALSELDDGGDVLVQAAAIPTDATIMNSPGSLFI
jgi:hypothetical protein